MPRPLINVLISNAVLAICSCVVLGIAAYVEHTTRKIGYKSSTYTFDAFVGAYTLVVLFAIIILRLVKPAWIPLFNEVILSFILWSFWLAAAASTTYHTKDDRQVCKHIDDLFDLPEFENADQDAIALAKKIFKSTCRDVKAQLAFVWIGFVILTITSGYLAYLITRRGISMWKSTLHSYDHDSHALASDHHPHQQDPFADPIGSRQGPVAGIANEDPDFKP
ncbi:uncharacterized protein IL334_004558 [Kwoniella shivajii]|uniref:MARVEL domain-containing protein n=1 Tax=Kwoniella shivajii TaxID=564305 RepID=A0ABZ1D0M6_9TREE|nr:hypothetical protein IL334_004558 [Kwoniella shivajii]